MHLGALDLKSRPRLALDLALLFFLTWGSRLHRQSVIADMRETIPQPGNFVGCLQKNFDQSYEHIYYIDKKHTRVTRKGHSPPLVLLIFCHLFAWSRLATPFFQSPVPCTNSWVHFNHRCLEQEGTVRTIDFTNCHIQFTWFLWVAENH